MLSFLRHLLIPTSKNNFRAKAIHNSSLLVIIFAILMFSAGVVLVKKTNPGVLGISYSISEAELLDGTNAVRAQNNMPSFSLNPALSDAARRKAANMFEHDYWAHFGPDGASPWSFMKAAGYNYTYAGENLAKGFTTSQDVVSAWMNSPSHRENILSSKYKEMGFAVVEGKLQGEETVLVVQLFGSLTTPQVAENNAPSEPQKIEKVAEVNKPVVVDTGSQQVASQVSRAAPVKPIIDSQKASKSLVTVFLSFIIVTLLLDIIIVEKRKIPRLVGHNLDHIILLTIFLLFIFLTTSKGIL